MRAKAFDEEGWEDIERALRGRTAPEPSVGFEDRVLEGVRRALSEPNRPRARRWSPAAHWAAVAAVLIVGLALSQMAASVTPFFDRPVPAPPVATVRAAADLMRQVSPGLTPDEADRLALASAFRDEPLPIPVANVDTTLAVRAAGLNVQGEIR